MTSETGGTGPTPHSLGTQAMPYSVIVTWGAYSIVIHSYVHYWPSYPPNHHPDILSRQKIAYTKLLGESQRNI